MGELIDLAERREARRRRTAGPVRAFARAEFFFDLACPFSYLAAERVERTFDDVIWTPAAGGPLGRLGPAGPGVTAAAVRRLAEERARELRMPLVWPDRFPTGTAAMRVAAFAAERGRGAALVLAASRLAFCGGFDLDHPDMIAEAAAAAGLALEDGLEAACDRSRDAAAEAAGRALVAAGADRLPALRVGRTLHWGERRVGNAVAAARWERVVPG
jgi:2-hydroxychromene-2-carboxylate isomerase